MEPYFAEKRASWHFATIVESSPGSGGMIEREMQELLWRYPERFLNEPLQQFAWEFPSPIGRADLVFEDRHGRLLIIEVKRGKLPRGAIDRLLDYFGMIKLKFPEKPVEMMVVANVIPPERQLTCESREIECRSIYSAKLRRKSATPFEYARSAC
jgi:RecB family endonuclease NucS